MEWPDAPRLVPTSLAASPVPVWKDTSWTQTDTPATCKVRLKPNSNRNEREIMSDSIIYLTGCANNICSTGLDCVTLNSGSLRCVCPPGQMCSGTCDGTMANLNGAVQTCQGNMWDGHNLDGFHSPIANKCTVLLLWNPHYNLNHDFTLLRVHVLQYVIPFKHSTHTIWWKW